MKSTANTSIAFTSRLLLTTLKLSNVNKKVQNGNSNHIIELSNRSGKKSQNSDHILHTCAFRYVDSKVIIYFKQLT